MKAETLQPMPQTYKWEMMGHKMGKIWLSPVLQHLSSILSLDPNIQLYDLANPELLDMLPNHGLRCPTNI